VISFMQMPAQMPFGFCATMMCRSMCLSVKLAVVNQHTTLAYAGKRNAWLGTPPTPLETPSMLSCHQVAALE
jgi:hypothetical protein